MFWDNTSVHLEAFTGGGACPDPPPVTVAKFPSLSFPFPEVEPGCNSSGPACEPRLGPQLQLVGVWTCKIGSHLRLPFSMDLIVCSTDIPFPHFTGFLYTFLFYPRHNNHWESYYWTVFSGGGQSLMAPLNTFDHLFALLSFLFSSQGFCCLWHGCGNLLHLLPFGAPQFLCGTFLWTTNRAICPPWKHFSL